MRPIEIENFIIETPVIDIIYDIQRSLTNGKLRDISKKGDNIVVSCPFHSEGLEQKAAGNVYIGDDPDITMGFFRCFVCDTECNFVKFVAACFDASYEYAKNWLITKYGKQAYEKTVVVDQIEIKEPKLFQKNETKNKNETILESYEPYCPYLAKRGISRGTAEKLKIKYDPQYKQIIFPVYDRKDKLITLLKRSTETKQFYIDKDLEHKPLLYMNLVEKNNLRRAVCVEGLFDAAKCYENNIPAVAFLGQVSDWQIEQLNKSSIEVLYIATDNDQAGREFRKTIKEKLAKRILVIDVEFPNSKKDIGDMNCEEISKLAEKYNLPRCF